MKESPPRIEKIHLRNFKSIGDQLVELDPFTLFVGSNGTGKSNFLDAIHFVQESVSQTIDYAFRSRGGINAVRRRSRGHPYNIGIRLEINLGNEIYADYSFEISAKHGESYRVKQERCVVNKFMEETHQFETEGGEFKKELPGISPVIEPDDLILKKIAGEKPFNRVYDFLSSMRFYSIVPSELREYQEAAEMKYLKKDGSNAASIMKQLETSEHEWNYNRLCEALRKVVQGVESVEFKSVGQKETISFRLDVGDKNPWRFEAMNMSDGTLRVFGLLLAIYQTGDPSVVGIEEPESTVHPAVAEVIVDLLMGASTHRQVLVTTHSPDILDYKDLPIEALRIVGMEKGETFISGVKEETKEILKENLYSAGELLSKNELKTDREASVESSEQLSLFGEPFKQLKK